MQKQTIYTICTWVFLLSIAFSAYAGMGSENYRIPTSVLSAGGEPMASTHYQTDSTLGQPSPLMEADQNPSSDNYDNYPGFWYTIEMAAVDICECDLNADGKCDMQDWLLFGGDWGRTDCGTPPGSGDPPNDCECDLNTDGKCDMQDWLCFGEDWGRTDCP